MVQLAIKTLGAIERTMEADQGASFRVWQGRILPHMKDAYRGADKDGGVRSHLGASVIGAGCDRAIWYGFRWAKAALFPARILRLFNRGHLEEARFLAMLSAIGCQVFQQDAQGRQYSISDLGGHFGGSGDGIALGIPDIPPNQRCVLEFKTHGEKSFLKLQKEGLRDAKPEHFVQMQMYMNKMGIRYGLYAAVNKNTDEIYMEIIELDVVVFEKFIARAETIVFGPMPEKLHNASPGWFACKFCDKKDICFGYELPDRNCRTCHFVKPMEDGTWVCTNIQRKLTVKDPTLSKEDQLQACPQYTQF